MIHKKANIASKPNALKLRNYLGSQKIKKDEDLDL